MLISLRHRIAFLAMTKAASTAVEAALAPHCEIVVGRDPKLKHMPLRRFQRHFPKLAAAYGVSRLETVCLYREPAAWLASWYRYRQRDDMPNAAKSTQGLGFEAFVSGYFSRPAPLWAQIGSPARFVQDATGNPGVDHIFRYENFADFGEFISSRFGTVLTFELQNVSPPQNVEISPGLRSRIESEMAEDVRIWRDIAR